MQGRYLSSFFSALLIILGSSVIIGWVFHIPGMVQVIPGLVGMVFNTAFSFIMTGILLWISNQPQTTLQRFIQIFISIAIFMLALITLSQDLFNYNLGTDQLFIHVWLNDPNPTPGRMAPNTSIAFMLIALIGFLLPYGNKKSIAIILQVFTFLILLIALLGLLIYSLKLEFIFSWYRYTRMAMHTAIGFLIASFGLWATISHSNWYKEFYRGQEDKKIILITGIILLCISMVVGLGATAWLTYINISSVEQSLEDSLKIRTDIIANTILSLDHDVHAALQNPYLEEALLNQNTTKEDYIKLLDYFNTKGFATILLLDAKGNMRFQKGATTEHYNLAVPLNSENTLFLFWKDGFWLQFQIALKNSTVGNFIGEVPLLNINQIFRDYKGIGNSGEIAMCTLQDKNYARCFPTRFTHEIFAIPLIKNDKPLPISYALAGQHGVVHAIDYRNHNVIAAYNKIKPFPLGIVLKIDTAEIYKPINQQLTYILPIGVLFICGGLMLLYWQVVPLVRKVVISEHKAHKAKIQLESSLLELSQRNKEINLLRELSANFQSCLNLDESFLLISKAGGKLLPDTMGIFYVIHPSHNYLEAVASWGNGSKCTHVFKIEDCWALRQGTSHKIEKVQTAIICKHISNLNMAFTSTICLPLFAQGKVIGLLFVGLISKSTSESDANSFMIANALSEQISIGFSNIQLREKLHDQSIHDPLTGLFNRRYIEEVLDVELLQVKQNKLSLSVMMLDIDHFKLFNDKYGHDAGDAVLISVAQTIKNQIRSRDFVCRFGGEEFIFIMPGAPREVALERARMLHESINTLKLMYNNNALEKITISIGLAVFPDDGDNTSSIIKAADIALYEAKTTGRNKTVMYHDSK